jgi:Undecaprenyl-phosphate galactose phosphotransferase WbaP
VLLDALEPLKILTQGGFMVDVTRTLVTPTTQHRTLSTSFTALILATTDFLSVTVSFLLVSILSGSPEWLSPTWYKFSSFVLVFLWPFIYWREGLYPGYGLTRPEKFRKYVVGAFLAGWLLLILKPFTTENFDLTYQQIILSTILSVFITFPVRVFIQRLLNKLGAWGEPVVILGAGNTGCSIATILRNHPVNGLKPVAFFDDDANKVGSRMAGIPVVGTLADAGHYAQRMKVHHAIIAIPKVSPGALSSITSGEGQVFKKVQFIPHMSGLPVHSVNTGSIDNYLTLEFHNKLRIKRNQIMKRFVDITGAVLGGLLISPLLLLLSLLIMLDSRGPIVYSQKRLGRGNKPFKVYKFRSMVKNADEVLKEHLAAHPELRREWEETHKLKDDPRVTRVGRFIRRYSLDELPQLWNVLKGDMSLVGPRPIVDAEVARYEDAFGLYCLVRPGMTGYWQVSGRSNTSYERRVELDSFYIRNWSIWLDITILMGTVGVVVYGDGAY